MFEEFILPHISPYFRPLQRHLIAFWRALHPQISQDILPRSQKGIHSLAKPEHILNVFKTALNDPALVDELKGPQFTRQTFISWCSNLCSKWLGCRWRRFYVTLLICGWSPLERYYWQASSARVEFDSLAPFSFNFCVVVFIYFRLHLRRSFCCSLLRSLAY